MYTWSREKPAFNAREFPPLMLSQLVVLSPLHEQQAYLIVPAVALRVSTRGLSSGATSTQASYELFPISSVCMALPHRPSCLLLTPSGTGTTSSAHSHLSLAMLNSLLSFQKPSMPTSFSARHPSYHHWKPAFEVRSR